MYIAAGYLLYKVLFSKEGFALSSGITDKTSDLDLTKYYFIGNRTTSNTKTPATNGGTECPEFNDFAYKLAPKTDAVCQPNGPEDAFYTFVNTTKVGAKMFPFKVQSLRQPEKYWHPQGGAVTPDNNTNVVWFDGFLDKSTKNGFVFNDDGTITHSGSRDLCLGRNNVTATLSKAYCDGNHRFTILPNGGLQHSSGLCLMGYSNPIGNGDEVRFGACDNKTDNTSYSANKLLYQDIGLTDSAGKPIIPTPRAPQIDLGGTWKANNGTMITIQPRAGNTSNSNHPAGAFFYPNIKSGTSDVIQLGSVYGLVDSSVTPLVIKFANLTNGQYVPYGDTLTKQ
jgi:hypothetical protein